MIAVVSYSITPEERELLEPDALDRLETLLDLEEPVPGEWPYEHPPGAARRLDRAGRDDRDLATPDELEAFLDGGRP